MAGDQFVTNPKSAEELRKLGFSAVLTHNPDGIARGTGAVVHLGAGRDNEVMMKSNATAHFSLDKGSSKQLYPVALMGCIALLRQTYLDADWYKRGGHKKEANLSLEAFNRQTACPPCSRPATASTCSAPTRWATSSACSTSSRRAATNTPASTR
jgi:hypothetical protein